MRRLQPSFVSLSIELSFKLSSLASNSSSQSESTNPKNFAVPSCLPNISSRNCCFSLDWNPLSPSSLLVLSLKWIKHLRKVAKRKFLLKPSINAFFSVRCSCQDFLQNRTFRCNKVGKLGVRSSPFVDASVTDQ